jgi:beta-fructofuranosidase
MTLPRELSLDDDGTLHIEPVEELERLRSDHREERDVALVTDADYRPERIGIQSRHVELSARIDVGDAEEAGVKLCRFPDGEEETLVSYEPAEEVLRIHTRDAGLSETVTNP